jgi:hypothetical protein
VASVTLLGVLDAVATTYIDTYFVLTLNGWGYIKQDAILCYVQTNVLTNVVAFSSCVEVYTTNNRTDTTLTFTQYENQTFLAYNVPKQYYTDSSFALTVNFTRQFVTQNKGVSLNPINLYQGQMQ